jgi:UDP-N-acetylglucosamine--N-acetylmuramyl-(pentapeptide) pyrophosphoryl-undecaprenol N-acetylglucosamine transferase
MRILVVTGSSGGHIFPALGFLDTLKDTHEETEALLVLSRRSIANQIRTSAYKINYISVSSIKLSLDFKNVIAILGLFKGCIESIFILLAFKPDIVVGFGSLVSVPLIMFAWALGIKNLIHEQNVVPGKANRFLAGFTDRVAVSFIETKDYFADCQRKIVFTGSPMRRGLTRIDKNKALDFFGFNDNKFTLLVMGGSQGSHRINTAFLRAISSMEDKTKVQVIHLAGEKDYDFLKQSYKDLKVNIKLFGFLEAMQYAYSASDLVLARAGATTITEIIFFGLPAVIIPYPYAYKHQLGNAKVLAKKGSAAIVQDEALDTNILNKILEDVINNPHKVKTMRSACESFSRVDANNAFMNNALSLYNG